MKIIYLLSALMLSVSVFADSVKSLTLTSTRPEVNVDFESSTGSGTRISYSPNASNYTGVELSYNEYSGGFNFTDGRGSVADQHISEVEDYWLSKINDKTMWELYYQSYSGYYVSDSSDVALVQTDKSFVSRSDFNSISTRNKGANLTYTFDKTLSLKTIIGHESVKKKTDSGWLVHAGFNSNTVKSRDKIIPTSMEEGFPLLAGATEIDSYSASIGGGWAGQFVYKGFFTNISMIVTTGAKEQKIKSSNRSATFSGTASGNQILISLGYFGKSNLWGIESQSYGSSVLYNGKYSSSVTKGRSTMFCKFFF